VAESSERPPITDEGFHFVDFLSAIVESWKYLLFLPLLGGAVMLGLTYLSPPKFRSVAIASLPPPYVAASKDPAVLNAVIQKLGLLEKHGGSMSAARAAAENSYFFVADGTNRYIATFYCDNPACAKELGDVVFKTLFEVNRPKGYNKEQLEQKLQLWTETRDRLLAAIKTAEGASKLPTMDTPEGDKRTTFSDLAELINSLQNAEVQIMTIRNELHGIGEEALIQPPMLPQESILAGGAARVIVTMLAIGFLVALAAAIAESIRQYRRWTPDPHYARLMRALHLK